MEIFGSNGVSSVCICHLEVEKFVNVCGLIYALKSGYKERGRRVGSYCRRVKNPHALLNCKRLQPYANHNIPIEQVKTD